MTGQGTARRGLAPSHPGRILRETVLPGLDMTTTAVAVALKVHRRTLYKVLEEKSGISAEMALRLAKLLGTSPELWLNLQATYDLHQLRGSMADELEGITPVENAPAVEG